MQAPVTQSKCPINLSQATEAAAAPVGGIAAEFERRYDAWRREQAAIAYSSKTSDYIALPSFRRIVALGPAALPFLKIKLIQDHGGDFMLAEAVVRICGWDRRTFPGDSEQAFRDEVLRRLGAAPKDRSMRRTDER